MSLRREEIVRARLEELLQELRAAKTRVPLRNPGISREDALACIEAAYASRLLDFEARELKNEGLGYYTIGSAGHEGNVALGRLLRLNDPCLLHYRSGALTLARLQQQAGESPIYSTLLSFLASSEDPVSGGRHKVWGSKKAWIPPQTSTIASQLPKAVGMAFAIDRASRLGLDDSLPEDAIVCTSFGDASSNHASAQTAFNAAAWAAQQRIPVPVLFVCEDNGVGISVHTPDNWIMAQFAGRRGIDYFEADGGVLGDLLSTTRRAIDHCRSSRRPTFLHLRVVRLLGHAGSDVEALYHDEAHIEATEAKDPLLRMTRELVEVGLATGEELWKIWHDLAARIDRVRVRATQRPKLESAEEIMRDLAMPDAQRVHDGAASQVSATDRKELWAERLPEEDRPRHLAMQLSRALKDLMFEHREILVFGEDVAKKGGVYHVTAGLYDCFGVGRVFNTLLDETMILGLAIGAAQIGFLPMPEIQYLAYLHNAEDQIRGEACSQRFFSDGQWDNPMVIRIAGLAYQKGFGGHFHNDNSIGVLRDIPGLILAAPSRGDDAVHMLRACVAAAKRERCVCVFLEPIALYMRKDLHEKGDARWSFPYPSPLEESEVVFGRPRLYESEAGSGPRILIASYSNGVLMALRARKQVDGCRTEVLDLRWLSPLPTEDFLLRAAEAEAVLIVDECRKTGGGVAEALLAALAEDSRTRGTLVRRVTAEDTYIPLGAADQHVLPQDDSVRAGLESLLAELKAEEAAR